MFTSAGCVIAAVFIVSLLVLVAETPYVGTVPLGPWGVLPWALGPGVSRGAGPL